MENEIGTSATDWSIVPSNNTARAVSVTELWVPAAEVTGSVVWLALRRILLAATAGGETTKVRFAERDKLSIIVIVAVPACEDVKTAVAVPLATATFWLVALFPNFPSVVAKVTEDAPGTETTMVFAVFVTITELLAGEVTAITVVARPLIYAWDLALPIAVTFTLELPAANPDTATVAIPDPLVTAVVALKPRTAGSVAANDTVTPEMGTPNVFLTVALSVPLEPPTTSEETPELFKAMLAPTTLTVTVAGVAVHAVHDAVSVETRLV